MKKIITVCICTHAPNPAILPRVIDALSRQTIDPERWQVLLIENSEKQTCDVSMLSSLPCSHKLMIERKPGKVNAMAAACDELSGDWVIFVDDDNVLNHDYLEKLLDIADEHPKIGVMSASICGEFEVPVPIWAEQFLHYIAIRPLSRSYWANIHGAQIGPIGAGMCVKREIYDEFVKAIDCGDIDSSLGRTSGSLTAGTDDTVFMDIAFRLGYGCGSFQGLELTHLIKQDRLTLPYFRRIAYDMTRSHTILELKRNAKQAAFLRTKLLIYAIRIMLKCPTEERAIKLAMIKGKFAGLREGCK